MAVRRLVLWLIVFGIAPPSMAAPGEPKSWDALTARVERLYAQGAYREASTIAREALQIAETRAGHEHPSVAASLEHLGELCRVQGQFREAESLLARAVIIHEQRQEPHALAFATTLHRLALVQEARGQFAKAENTFARALGIAEASLQEPHPQLISLLNNFGNLYVRIGDAERAEPFYRRALAMERRLARHVLEEPRRRPRLRDEPLSAGEQPVHPDDTWHPGPLEGVEPLPLRALAEPDLPPPASGPLVSREASAARDAEKQPRAGTKAEAVIMNNLAELSRRDGRFREAEPLFEDALSVAATLGDTATQAAVTGNLAETYRAAERYVEAEPLARQALELEERNLERNQAARVHSLNNLAALYQSQGRYAEAEALYKKALTAGERALGADHQEIARLLANLAGLYVLMDKPDAAHALYARALTLEERIFGAEHPRVATMAYRIAMAGGTAALQAAPAGQQRYHRVLAMAAQSMNQRAVVLSSMGRYGAAEDLFKGALAVYDRTFGPRHPDTAIVLQNYAFVLRKLGRGKEAVEMEARASALLSGDHAPATGAPVDATSGQYRGSE